MEWLFELIWFACGCLLSSRVFLLACGRELSVSCFPEQVSFVPIPLYAIPCSVVLLRFPNKLFVPTYERISMHCRVVLASENSMFVRHGPVRHGP